MERCFAAETTISISLIAVLPEAGYEIRKIHPPGVASAPTSGLVAGTRVAGISGFDLARAGIPVRDVCGMDGGRRSFAPS